MDKSREYFFGCICVLLTAILITSIILGSIGASSYVTNKHGESVYKPTMCFVKKYTIINETCSSSSCYGFGSCTTNYYSCDTPLYTVGYNVSDGKEVESTIKGKDGPGPDSVNKAYKCYYDSTNETAVRWTWFDSYKYLIMMCVGWSIVGFFILLCIGSIVRCICLKVMESRKQMNSNFF